MDKAGDGFKSMGRGIEKGFDGTVKFTKDLKIGDKIGSFWGKITGKKKKEQDHSEILPGVEEEEKKTGGEKDEKEH